MTSQIGGDDIRVGGLVGKDQAVGGAGEHVDADAAVEDALGFGDELVAGADQNVRLGEAEQAERHGGDALPTPGRGGEQATMLLQPATLAVVTVMMALAMCE